MTTIKDLIKESSFQSNGHKAYVNLLYTYYYFYDLHCNLLKKYDLLPQHYNVLRIIKDKYPEPVTPGNILEVMLDKKRDLTRLVDKLVNKGYVVRTQNPSNKKFILINLTNEGLNSYNDMEEIAFNLYHRLDEDESELFSNLLDKMRPSI